MYMTQIHKMDVVCEDTSGQQVVVCFFGERMIDQAYELVSKTSFKPFLLVDVKASYYKNVHSIFTVASTKVVRSVSGSFFLSKNQNFSFL